MAWIASAQPSQAPLCRPRSVHVTPSRALALRAPPRPFGAVWSPQSPVLTAMASLSAHASPVGGSGAVALRASHPRTAATGRSARLASPLRVCAAASSQHDGAAAHECALCRVHAHSAAQLQQHLGGRRHAKAVRRAEAPEFAARAEASLCSLDTMNGWLTRLGHEEAETKTAARRELRNIHINIYDLVEDRLQPVFETVPELRKYSKKEGKIFPLAEAKAD